MKNNPSDKKLDVLILAVEKLLANPVAPVLPVLPIAPVAPVAPIIPPNSGDHDFLLTFSSEVKIKLDNIADNIRILSDGTASRISILENEKLNTKDSYPVLYKPVVDKRLDTLESKADIQDTTITKIWSYGIAALFAMGVIEFLISKFL